MGGNIRGRKMIAVKIIAALAEGPKTQRELSSLIDVRVQTISHNMRYLDKMKIIRPCGQKRAYSKTNGSRFAFLWALHPRLGGAK